MAFKGSGWRKLAQFMPYHLLSDINRNMLSIVNCNSMPDHVRYNHTGTRPVFSTFFSPFYSSLQCTQRNFKSTYGPFFDDRTKGIPPPIIIFSSQSIYRYFYSCGFIPFRILSPRRYWLPPTMSFIFSTSVDGQSGS